MKPELLALTDTITERSRKTRELYLTQCENAARTVTHRSVLGCTNIAHAAAASPANDKLLIHAERQPNLGIVTAYNDMLSAHQPYQIFPDIIKQAARDAGATAQVAGGVPAMCDGVTQGRPGMELSLFSRDTIAMGTAVALSHDMFDAGLYLGVCDKIVPGLLIGALSFGHLPAIFVPAGPMTSGMSNSDKAKTRQLFAEGKATRDDLLASESASYHGPGTCTFYGTANSNQMMMEFMGLHMPGAAFVNPGTPLREALTKAAATRAVAISRQGESYTPISQVVDEKAIVNALVGLMATGGSTNHTLHLVAIARAAGILINWDDFHAAGKLVPLLTHIYPSGQADVNQFHAAGGLALVISELLNAGLVHEDVTTIAGKGLSDYTREPFLETSDVSGLTWKDGPRTSLDTDIIGTVAKPFQQDGGLQLLTGNMGRAVIKTSAVKSDHRVIEAPARVFHSQQELHDAFEAGELERDFVAVVRCQGPQANGMPELHKLTPVLGILLDRGFRVGLVTDGRMSGASGKVPAAIHVSPESVCGGAIGKIKDGDPILIDSLEGRLEARVSHKEWATRELDLVVDPQASIGMGRDLFAHLRMRASSAESGASLLQPEDVNSSMPDTASSVA